jgi:tRNA uridine 5-carboxymethylaminomethyl modification enzyme
VNQDGSRRDGFALLAFPDVGFEDVVRLMPELEGVVPEIQRQVERDALYSNYIERQQKDVEALKKDEAHAIPRGFNFNAINGLSNELKAKLTRSEPTSLAQAARIDGMTPAALALLLATLRRGERKKTA